MEFVEVAPPPAVREHVHSFWFLRGTAVDQSVQTIVPDGRSELVLHLGDRFAELDAAGIAHPQSETLVAGQLTAPFRLMPRGHADVVGIKLCTAGARAVLGFPPAEVAGRVTDLSSCRRDLARALIDAAARHDEPMARVASLSRAIAWRIAGGVSSPLVSAAVRALGDRRSPSVAALAGRLGVSTRTLERRVLDVVGLSPSMLRRVLRFRRAFRALDGLPPGTWTRTAMALGYFDQAHLIRDFREFAGAAPSTFLEGDAVLARVLLGSEDPAA